jgi:branched-chain amino acid transport system ATP-binding protein/urea transport system ATP-binding protein
MKKSQMIRASRRPISVPALLDINDLVCGYGGGVVLENLSLSIKPGERVGLLGRNGVGKTTLLKTIMGLVPITSGNIALSGASLNKKHPHQVAGQGIGYVPQGREIFADFTVQENLQLGDLTASSFDEIYQLFPVLKQRAHSRAGSFSGGQQQQLAIGRALVAKPKLLLLDEPSEGVQPSIVHEIGQTLVNIAKNHTTAILLVEQNVDMVLNTCERCVFIEGGQISASHTSDYLRANPGTIEQFMGL